MEIFKNFGVDLVLLSAQIVNFLIVLYILKRFFYKKILDVLKKRQETIKEGLKQAEESRLLLEKTVVKEKDVLKRAQLEAKKLLEETRKQSEQILTATEAKAKIQAQKVLEDAKKQIVLETKEAQRVLSMQISGLAIELLQKSTVQIFSKEDQEDIIKNAIQKIRKKVD